MVSQIAKFMGPTWGPPGSCRPQMGPMLAPWTLLLGFVIWGQRMTVLRVQALDINNIIPLVRMKRSWNDLRKRYAAKYNRKQDSSVSYDTSQCLAIDRIWLIGFIYLYSLPKLKTTALQVDILYFHMYMHIIKQCMRFLYMCYCWLL